MSSSQLLDLAFALYLSLMCVSSSLYYSVKNFNALRKKRQLQKANRRRQELEEQRNVLIRNGKLSPDLITVLKKIFFSYAGRDEDTPSSEPLLDVVTASRLWYRCGLMLSELCIIVEEKAAETIDGSVDGTFISAIDFIESVSNVVEEEETVSVETYEDGPPSFEVRDETRFLSTKFSESNNSLLLC